MKAPIFSLPDQNGDIRSLNDYMGKWILIYFYPRDNTPGCTTEACNFRDNYEAFTKKGIVILGISRDSISSHKKFSEKYDLNFTLLTDSEAKVIKAYNSWGNKGSKLKARMGILRKSFLINPEGKIVKQYPKVKPAEHAQEILSDIESFQ